MILSDFIFLAGDTERTKVYLHALIEKEYYPSICVVYYEAVKGCSKDLINILLQYKISFECLETNDVNSDIVSEKLLSMSQKYVIYSGYGGVILKSHLFKMNKYFIHIHAGILPMYRGSTTAYYSILNENTIGATAIFMNEGIDEGDIITSVCCPLPVAKIDIDYEYEPYVRSRALIKAIELYNAKGKLEAYKQSSQFAETYYIVHPVLKHIALLKMNI